MSKLSKNQDSKEEFVIDNTKSFGLGTAFSTKRTCNNVAVAKVKPTITLLKLLMQKKQINTTSIDKLAKFLFDHDHYDPETLVSIAHLQSQLEELEIKESKCKKLARYLIEPESNDDFMFSAFL